MSTKDDTPGSPPEHWNPDDGPPPTDEERAEARALAEALVDASPAHRRDRDPDLDALVDVALRVRATAHPDPPEKIRATAHAAVEHAVTHAGQRWYRARWRWLALVAAAVVGVGGAQLALFRDGDDDGGAPISHPATDVFTQPVGEHAGSDPIDRIADSRMRAWRDGMLHARGGRRSP
jgi:hypothetical protein